METFTEEWTKASLHLKRGSTFRKQQTSVKVHWPLSSLIHGKASPVERVVAAVAHTSVLTSVWRRKTIYL